MLENRFKLTENGRVIIPSNYRKTLQLTEGEEMVMRIIDGEIRIYSLRHALENARKTVSKYIDDSVSLVDLLHTVRKQEYEQELAGMDNE